MNKDQQPLSKVFEEVMTKSIEANKLFLNEGSRLFRQLGNPKSARGKTNALNSDVLSGLVREYVKLNLVHYNNLMDLGLNFMRQVSQSASDSSTGSQPDDHLNKPGFILEKETIAGESVHFRFLLDNIKEELVNCQFVHTAFSTETDTEAETYAAISVLFTPSHFELKPAESKPVEVVVQIPAGTMPGIYSSKVQVKGFDPAYFLIRITVTETQKQQTPDGGKKEKSSRK